MAAQRNLAASPRPVASDPACLVVDGQAPAGRRVAAQAQRVSEARRRARDAEPNAFSASIWAPAELMAASVASARAPRRCGEPGEPDGRDPRTPGVRMTAP